MFTRVRLITDKYQMLIGGDTLQLILENLAMLHLRPLFSFYLIIFAYQILQTFLLKDWLLILFQATLGEFQCLYLNQR